MKKMKKLLVVPAALMMTAAIHAQDPSFSQFYSSPLNINPALTANIYSKLRFISNYRTQWIGPSDPYTTGTVSFDTKIFQNVQTNYVDEITRVGIGSMLMYDNTLSGGLKSTYASLNVTGNVRLARGNQREMNGYKIRHLSKIKMDLSAEQRLGIGLGVSYGNRRIDITKLTFEDQFVGTGFDTNLPTGETALSTMKPFLSANAGIIYSITSVNEYTNFDIGVAAFHINRPRQTFLSDENSRLPIRYVAHANFERALTDIAFINTNAIYQYQGGASYFSIGGGLGYYLPTLDVTKILTAGLWYWSNNAIIPYFSYTLGDFQVGFSYDVTISKLKEAPKRAHTFEISMIIRGGTKAFDGIIPAPWK